MRQVIESALASHTRGNAEAIIAHARRFDWGRCADAHIALYLQLLDRA
jgi:hypothetical protein